ncbi:MAG: endo alpha-1,4 polygalactosaminidase [Nitrospinae bacterium]|nr:endo alpha-1,4 polygalactosaminidase [Nitrospinota bacterium]
MRRIVLSLAVTLAACSGGGGSADPGLTPEPTPTPAPTRWIPAPGTGWQWQLSGDIDTSFDVAVYDIDLFDADAATVASLKAAGRRVVCYLSAGSHEDWRPDAGLFPREVLGRAYDGWPGERWLDIRRIDLLAPILEARLDLCRDKGFDAVEPDNVDGYANATGFPLTADDQLAFNRWLAKAAHDRGLSIGLKNDPLQVSDLVGDFDWALTEDCGAERWCDAFAPFVAAGKAHFAAEYTDAGIDFPAFCADATPKGISPILKDRELTAPLTLCP